MGLWGAIAGAVTGGVLGIVTEYTRREAAKEQLKNQQKDIKEAMSDQGLNWLDYQKDYNFNVQQNALGQQIGARSSAVSSMQQYKSDVASLTSTIVEASSTKGSFRQRTASSGFRNTGSLRTIENIASRRTQKAVADTEQNVVLNAQQRFEQARLNYLNADTQQERYEEAFRRQMRQYSTTMQRYNDQLKDIDKQLDNLKTDLTNSRTWFDYGTSSISGSLQGAAAGAELPF